MYASSTVTDEILRAALTAVERGGDGLFGALDALAAPIYVTDAHGVITHFNRACIEFAGRTPVIGKDRWCVSWKLYTDEGVFLPHDQCPMALAIRTKRPVRGVRVAAERPDGGRVDFMPFPMLWLSEDGELLGAINLLIDVTGHRQTADLLSQAYKCRRLADGSGDRRTVDTLHLMAAEFEAKAVELEQSDPSARHGVTIN